MQSKHRTRYIVVVLWLPWIVAASSIDPFDFKATICTCTWSHSPCLFIATSTRAVPYEFVFQGRQLTQTSRRNRPVVVSTSEELLGAVDEISSGQTIQIQEGRYVLTRGINITVDNITISGVPAETTIICPTDGTGLFIRANNSLIRGVTFETCQNAPAVVVGDLTFEGAVAVSVTFERVEFSLNTIFNTIGTDPYSAALTIQGCLVSPCNGVLAEVTVTSCLFRQNNSPEGGAIRCLNCLLTVIDTDFISNVASTSGGAIQIRSEESVVNITSSRFTGNSVARDGTAGSLRRASGFRIEPLRSFEFPFPRNRGGAISASTVRRLEVTDSVFEANRAPAGGAIAVQIDEIEIRSIASFSATLRVRDSRFFTNSANQSFIDGQDVLDRNNDMGGAIYLASSAECLESSAACQRMWDVENCVFRNNSAQHGGAIHIVALPTSRGSISGSTFERNRALQSGGAIVLRAVGQEFIENCTLVQNIANLGGAIFVTNNALLTLEGLSGLDASERTGEINMVEENSAEFGGGVLCIGCGDMIMRDVQFRRNTALRSGGGLYVLDTTSALLILHSTFDSNMAMEGGAVAARSASSISITAVNSGDLRNVFRNNTAVAGAGIFLIGSRPQGNKFEVERTLFTENHAVSITDPAFQFKEENRSDSVNDPSAMTSSFEGVADYPLTNCGNGGGGGMCLLFDEAPTDSLNSVTIREVNLTRNDALVGGALLVRVAGGGWNENRLRGCNNISPTTDPCRIFYLTDVKIRRNRAMFWAGGLFINRPQTILIGCSGDAPESYAFFLDTYRELNGVIDDPCFTIDGNVVTDPNGQGHEIGGVVDSLSVEDPPGPLMNHTGGQRLLPPCPRAASCLENRTDGVKVAVRDVFNQTITGGISDAALRIILISTSVLGEQIYVARKGVINVNNTVGVGVGQSSDVTFQHELYSDLNTRFFFATRSCYPGELNLRTECDRCMAEQYSFNTSSICRSCEDHAECPGGATLVPVDGYWHSTPFSPQFHKCIIEKACSFIDRNEKLRNYYRTENIVLEDLEALEAHLASKGTPQPVFQHYEQCNVGYEGTLCGSCSVGYGYFAGGECVKCPTTAGRAIVLIIAFSFLTFVIIAINIGLQISATKKQITIAIAEGRMKPPSYRSHQPGRSNNNSRGELELAGISGIRRPTDILGTQSSNLSVMHRGHRNEHVGEADHIIAIVKMTELIKILVNYLQVTSVALTISLSWNTLIKILLSVQNSAISVTSGTYYVPFDCVFGSSDATSMTPNSIKAFWWRVSLPIIFLIIFLIVVQLISTRQKHVSTNSHSNQQRVSGFRLTYSIVVGLNVLYFAYIGLISECMRAVNYIEVDKRNAENPHEYDRYAIQTESRYWAEDTELGYFGTDHLLTGILGGVGLVFLGMMIPVTIFGFPCFMSYLKQSDFIARFGFIYQGYEEHELTIGWEGVILLRKALISAAVVFAFPLGPNLQAVCALGVLLSALVLHWIFQPFKLYKDQPNVPTYCGSLLKFCGYDLSEKARKMHDRISLNTLESISLLMSSIVFYSGIVFNDSNTSESGKACMALFAFITNILFILYVAYRLYIGLHLILDKHHAYFSIDRNFASVTHLFPKDGGLFSLLRKGIILASYMWYHPGLSQQMSEYVSGDVHGQRINESRI